MTKKELIAKVCGQLNCTQKDARDFINCTLDTISDSLTNAEPVILRGFGVFDVKYREPRTGRNPTDGSAIQIAGRHAVSFKPANSIKDALIDK